MTFRRLPEVLRLPKASLLVPRIVEPVLRYCFGKLNAPVPGFAFVWRPAFFKVAVSLGRSEQLGTAVLQCGTVVPTVLQRYCFGKLNAPVPGFAFVWRPAFFKVAVSLGSSEQLGTAVLQCGTVVPTVLQRYCFGKLNAPVPGFAFVWRPAF